ncbi:hypothetical protein [Micropruina sp.]|uniref:hypothetical protein n=1 Tax=Micropruina sp. TaxID=2737536 RepID=UPI0039E380DA
MSSTIKASTPVRSNHRALGPARYDESPGCIAQSAMNGFDITHRRLFCQGTKLVKAEPFRRGYHSLTPVACGTKP